MRTIWWKDAVIYEFYVDAFAGNFRLLADKLDYFDYLGVNTLHILPHYPSPMKDDGYDVMDYLNVRPSLGTLDDFAYFMKEAQRRHIRVIVDLVLNHVSEHHPWFVEARSSRQSVWRDFFIWSETTTLFEKNWNAFPEFKSSNWIRNPDTDEYYYATFLPSQPDLNWNNPKVFTAVCNNMDFWANYGVSGFRLDAVRALVKRESEDASDYETRDIIQKLRTHLDTSYGGSIALLGEAHLPIPELKRFFGNDSECHMMYNFPLAEAMIVKSVLGASELYDARLEESKSIPDGCAWAVFLRNHDELSLATLPPEVRVRLLDRIDPQREHVIGSGGGPALRLAEFLPTLTEQRRAFDVLLATPGTPIIYYGDEIGMKNVSLDSHEADKRRGVRGTFDWNRAEAMRRDSDSLLNHVRRAVRERPSTLAKVITSIFKNS